MQVRCCIRFLDHNIFIYRHKLPANLICFSIGYHNYMATRATRNIDVVGQFSDVAVFFCNRSTYIPLKCLAIPTTVPFPASPSYLYRALFDAKLFFLGLYEYAKANLCMSLYMCLYHSAQDHPFLAVVNMCGSFH